MTTLAVTLTRRLLAWHLTLSMLAAGVASVLAPRVVLLRPGEEAQVTRALLAALGACGLLALVDAWWRLRRHRWVLRALALGSRSVESFEVEPLMRAPSDVTLRWWGWAMAGTLYAATFGRPELLDRTTGTAVASLAAVVLSMAAITYHVWARALVVEVLEQVPPEVVLEIVERRARHGLGDRDLARRLLLAVAAPVAFVALGAALIGSAHLRRADEWQRQETALAMARATLEQVPGVLPEAGLGAAREAFERAGYRVRRLDEEAEYSVRAGGQAELLLLAPLDRGAAELRFRASTVPVLGPAMGWTLVLAVALAIGAGRTLGGSLSRELGAATSRLSALGTDALLRGETTAVPRPACREVQDLERSIEALTERFRVFARDEERAIFATETTARTRGLLFASVSHDLKSPLNAVLGFAELVRATEPLTPGQEESLDLVSRRGRELLALIETILDAARVEAGHLPLHREPCRVDALLEEARELGRHLGGDSTLPVAVHTEGALFVDVDRVRLARVLGTFVGHALRSSRRDAVRLTAEPSGQEIRIRVDVPTRRWRAADLEAMLSAPWQRGPGGQRGLALGLGLARVVVELHGGTVRAIDREGGTAFVVDLPAASPAPPAVGAPEALNA